MSQLEPRMLQVGDPIPALVSEPISKVQLVRYAGASGDFNPIHWDADFARESGYAGPIAHGMLTMAFFGRGLSGFFGVANVLRLKARFRAVTFPGDILTISGTVTDSRLEEDGSRTLEISLEARREDDTITASADASVRVLG